MPHTFPFRLNHDPLRWTIALVLMSPALALANGGIAPIAGPQGTPSVSTQNGIPIIDIVAPNGQGLSHNQFNDYNVAEPGVVLNNALAAGQSALAGALGANGQFHGSAASTILNEVVGNQLSNINGPQEIFGQAADYVLANPNGIQVNGGSLINSLHATFLVGTPELENGRIASLSALDARGRLTVGKGGLTSDSALHLIAPHVDAEGRLQAVGELAVIVGRNRVQPGTGTLLDTRQPDETEARIDASLLGGMRAGRVRVVSTAQGAGVRVAGPEILGTQGVHLESAGSLHIGDPSQPTEIASREGDVSLDAKGDLSLANVQANGHDLRISSGKNLRIAPGVMEKSKTERESWNRKTLFVTHETYDETRTTSTRSHQRSTLTARNDMALQATGDIELTATHLDAKGEQRLQAGKDVRLLAASDREQIDTKVRHRKHLWRGDSDRSQVEEQAVPTSITGKQVLIASTGNTHIRGSHVDSGENLTIEADTLIVGGHELSGRDERKNYRGDLVSGAFFGNRENENGTDLTQSGSSLKADGELLVSAGDVTIKGSSVLGKKDAVLVSKNGVLELDSTHNLAQRERTGSDSKLLGLFGSSSSETRTSENAVVTQVESQSNLRLQSAGDLTIKGASATAVGTLSVRAEGTLSVSATANHSTERSRHQARYLTANASETRQAEDNKNASRQYEAKVGYEVATSLREKSTQTLTSAVLSGESVELNSAETLAIDSAKVQGGAGGVKVSGQRIELGSSQTLQSERQVTSTAGGGIGVTGGMDRQGSYSYGEHQRDTRSEQSTTASRTEILAKGDVHLIAGSGEGHIENAGARIISDSELKLTAGSIENLAISDTRSSDSERTNWRGTAGLNLETRDLTRPVEKLVDGRDQTVFQKGVEEALDAPTLGIDLAVSRTRRDAGNEQAKAVPSELQGNTVAIKVEGLLKDIGTRYEAAGGPLRIEAVEHQMLAARDSQSTRVNRRDVEGALRVHTKTGTDAGGRVSASGGSFDNTKENFVAVPGALLGKAGIQVQLGTDGRYEGTRIEAGTGALNMQTSKGSLDFAQADNEQRESTKTLEGFGWLRGDSAPTSGKGLGGGGFLSYKTETLHDTQAVAGSIDGDQAQLIAARRFASEGTRMGSAGRPLKAVEVWGSEGVKFLPAYDTHRKQGQNLGGGLVAGASRNPVQGAATTGGNLGGQFEVGRINETSRLEKTTGIHTGQFKATDASTADDAIHLRGADLIANSVTLDAVNGGISIEGAKSSKKKDNVLITAGVGANAKRTGTPDDNVSGFHGRLKVGIDNLDSTTYGNVRIRTTDLDLRSGADTRLASATVHADRIKGRVAGDLEVITQLDRVVSTKVDVDGRLSAEKNPQGLRNALDAVTGPLSSKVSADTKNSVAKLDPKKSPGLSVDFVRENRTTAARQTELRGRDGIDLQVEGNTRLTGASLKSSGVVDLGSDDLHITSLKTSDYRAEAGINLSNKPEELIPNLLKDVLGEKSDISTQDEHFNAGVLRTGGHDKSGSIEGAIIQAKR